VRVPQRPMRVEPMPDCTVGRLAQMHDLAGMYWAAPGEPPADAGSVCLPHVRALLEMGQHAPAGRFAGDLAAHQGSLILPRELANRHLLVLGQPGAGKSMSLVLPLALQGIAHRYSTQVVLSAKGDLMPWVAHAAALHGKPVLFIDPTDPRRSLGWHVLRSIKTEADASRIAGICLDLVERGRYETGFFHKNALRLLAGVLWELARQGSDSLNLATLGRAMSNASELLAFAKRHHLREAEEFADRIVTHGENNRSTTLDTVASALEGFVAGDVAAVTSTDELRFEQVTAEPCVLLINVPETESERLRPFVTLFVAMLIDHLYREAAAHPAQRLPIPVEIYLDEFASALGPMPGLVDKLSTARSRNIAITAAVQAGWQLTHRYGEAGAQSLMAAFSSLVVVPPCTIADAEQVSARCGLTRVQVAAMQGGCRHVETVERRLLTPYEVQATPKDPVCGHASTVMLAGLPAFYAYFPPVFRWPEYAEFGERLWNGRVTMESLLPVRETPLAHRGEEPVEEAAASPGRVAAHIKCVYCGGRDPRLTDTTQWAETRVAKRVELLLASLGYDTCTPDARRWFDGFTRMHKSRSRIVLRVLEELKGSSIQAFYEAFDAAGTDSVPACLLHLQFRRLRREHDEAAPKRQASA
jgi:hypothetical protein